MLSHRVAFLFVSANPKLLSKQSCVFFKNTVLMLVGMLVLLTGCAPYSTDAETTKAPTLSELVGSGTREAKEFQFCLSEETGIETLKDTSIRMKKVLDALPDSVANAELSQNKKDKLSKSVEELKSTFGSLETAVNSNASPRKLFKACSKVGKGFDSITKLSK